MARHNFREIVLMVLAVLGGLGILLLIGTRLIHVTAWNSPAGTGGVGAVVGGVSVSLFALAMVALVAIVVGLAVFLSRR
jgi:hypothetical protein